MKTMQATAMIGLLVGAASCAPKPAPEPERPPVIKVPSAPPVFIHTSPPAPPAVAWEDMALTPGDWTYREGDLSAVYGAGLFTVRCDPAARQVTLLRGGAAGGLTLRSSYGVGSLAGGAGGAVLQASDPLLDQILFSRGRFAVEAQGQTRLVLPTWPEPARVVEDCRG
jgi:hypothetical protein